MTYSRDRRSQHIWDVNAVLPSKYDSIAVNELYLSLDGWRVYYDAKGEGDPILLLHGTPTSAFIWRKLVDLLSKSYRVYALDLPGWGRSDRPEGFDYRLESYAEAIQKFLNEIGVKKVILGIHDLGAAVGFAFLLKSPERVSRLIILDTFAFMPGSKKLQWELLYRVLLRLPLVRNLVQWLIWEMVQHTNYFVSLAFYDKKLATRELVKKYRELSRLEADYGTFTANGINRIWEIVERNASRVKVPTLIVWAENDFLFPVSGGEKLHGAIKGSILRTIPSCGHFLQEERPDEVTGHILDFLGTSKERDAEYHQGASAKQGSVEKNIVAEATHRMNRAS